VNAILESHAEAAGNVDAGLVGEAHAGREVRHFAVDEVDGLVHVEPDTVAGPM